MRCGIAAVISGFSTAKWKPNVGYAVRSQGLLPMAASGHKQSFICDGEYPQLPAFSRPLHQGDLGAEDGPLFPVFPVFPDVEDQTPNHPQAVAGRRADESAALLARFRRHYFDTAIHRRGSKNRLMLSPTVWQRPSQQILRLVLSQVMLARGGEG